LRESQFLKPQIWACCNAPMTPSGQINETPTNDLNRAMAKGTEPTLAWPQ